MAPFVHLIHAVDSEKLLIEIDKQAHKNNRIIDVLLQFQEIEVTDRLVGHTNNPGAKYLNIQGLCLM